MAFWGVEVKPGKPITHSCENARGRLRISQATLGIGKATGKTIIQCNVGKRSPVLLCALLPNKTESCHLDLEFEEPDDVLFSVLGPRSVYLTGYYVQKIRLSNHQSDTESYGVDIENTHTEGSSYGSDDEIYDDSFINDGAELQFSPRSPVNNEGMDDEKPENDKLKDKNDGSFINDGAELQFSPRSPVNNEGMDDDKPENDTPKDKNDHGGQHRKKYCVIESDSDATHEGADEDDDKRAMETTTMSDDGEKDDNEYRIEPKQKVDCLRTNGEVEGETKLPLNEEKTELRNEKNELGTVEEINVSNEKVLTGDTIHENSAADTTNQMQSIDIAKSKKKRKQRSKEDKTCNIQTDNSNMESKLPLDEEKTEVRNEKNELGTVEEIDVSNEKVLTGDTIHENSAIDTTNQMQSIDIAKPKKKRKQRSKEDKTCNIQTDNSNMDIDENSEDGQKSKKIRNELGMDGINTDGTIENCENVLKDDQKSEEGPQHADNLTTLAEICTEGIGSESRDILKEDKYLQVLPHDDRVKEDLPAETGEYQDQMIDNIINTINKEILASDSQSKKKTRKKKKKKKTQDEKDLNMALTNISKSKETTPENADLMSKRILSNGLIIEELVHGPPDGKAAAPGKKVKIYYTAMLKETGHVFESNVGDTAYQFRLGEEDIIDGWNVGIDGMRVGDKRRLVIPPSMGFGDLGMGEDVPPNSWLVYEIELVSVRK